MATARDGNGGIWNALYERSGLEIDSFANLCGIKASTAKKYRYGVDTVPDRSVYLAKYAMIRLGHAVNIDLVDWAKVRKR